MVFLRILIIVNRVENIVNNVFLDLKDFLEKEKFIILKKSIK